MVKNCLPMQEMQDTRVPSLGQEDPLEKEMATHSSVLDWKIPMDRGAWWATAHRVIELDTTEGPSAAQHRPSEKASQT